MFPLAIRKSGTLFSGFQSQLGWQPRLSPVIHMISESGWTLEATLGLGGHHMIFTRTLATHRSGHFGAGSVTWFLTPYCQGISSLTYLPLRPRYFVPTMYWSQCCYSRVSSTVYHGVEYYRRFTSLTPMSWSLASYGEWWIILLAFSLSRHCFWSRIDQAGLEYRSR